MGDARSVMNLASRTSRVLRIPPPPRTWEEGALNRVNKSSEPTDLCLNPQTSVEVRFHQRHIFQASSSPQVLTKLHTNPMYFFPLLRGFRQSHFTTNPPILNVPLPHTWHTVTCFLQIAEAGGGMPWPDCEAKAASQAPSRVGMSAQKGGSASAFLHIL